MSSLSAPTTSAPLYPPTARPAARSLPLPIFLALFDRNPLRSLPRAVYDEPILTYGGARPLVAWVTDPGLIETILLTDANRFPKTRLDRRVLKPVVGDGLLTAEGESWRWQRKLAAPMFRHSELLAYVPTIVAAAEERVAEWRSRGAVFMSNVEEDMTHTTFAIIARTVLAGIEESNGRAIMRAGRAYLDPITWEVAASVLMLSENVWHPGKTRMRRAADESRQIVQHLIDQRRRDGSAGDDLLARMLNARDPDTGEPMSNDRVADNLATFLFAGHETTAKALTWTLYVLARAPDWQERVREELSSTLGSQPFDAAALTKIPLTSRVLKEALRLYPPVPVMTRVMREPMTLGGKAFEKPTLIVIPIYAVHRHRRLWDDPGRFDPDRFLPENEAGISRTQFMPFGYGQRLCIGMSFAMIEATAILATLLRSVRFEWDGKHEPEPVSRVTLRPKGGMPLRIRPL